MNYAIFVAMLLLDLLLMAGLGYSIVYAFIDSFTWLFVALGIGPSAVISIMITAVAWDSARKSDS